MTHMYRLPAPDAPTDRDTHFATWDRGDGNADGWWCELCLSHRTRRHVIEAMAWATYFCPVCIGEPA